MEIDPRIAQIGEQMNPDHPYQDPRVTVHINDGRAFLERTDKTVRPHHLRAARLARPWWPGRRQLRLESYLFTQQSLEAAKDHLKPGGAFAMYNYYREDWLVGRLGNTAAAAFGHDPCIDLLSSVRAVIVVGKTDADQTCGTDAQAVSLASLAGPAPASDNRPFLYLQEPGHPADLPVRARA